MKQLAQLRQDWTEIDQQETQYLRMMTLSDGLRQYVRLQAEFEPQLQATEAMFRPQRNQMLIDLQSRLLMLNREKADLMQNLYAALASLQQTLDLAGVPSIAIGGIALSIWGEPRLTRDVDVKVLAEREERAHLLRLLGEYSPLNADPDEALRRHGIAFFLDQYETRIDILLAETSFDQAAIARSKTVKVDAGLSIRVCSAEDLVVYKLISTRSRDRADVETIIRRQGNALNDAYIVRWLYEFEAAFDDSTLVGEYRRLRRLFGD
jgi:hypothetical protein